MEGFQHNRQEVNNQGSVEASELVTDPEELAELIAEAKEVRERMEEIPEEDEFGRRIISSREDYIAIEAEAKKYTDLLMAIPDSIKLQHGLPAGYHSPEAVNDNRMPQSVAA